MLVNHDLQFVFIHAGKCAGIAISQWLIEHYGFEYYGNPDLMIPGTNIVERHRFAIPDECRGYQVITSIREPFERWESFYLYQNLQMGVGLSFGEFTRQRIDWIEKQVTYASQADYIIRTDHLQDDVLQLPFVEDPAPEIPRLNVSRDQAEYDIVKQRIQWTDESRCLVESHFSDDFALWMKNTFEIIHETNGWNGSESVSGTGSTLEQTQAIRESLPRLIQGYGIKSLLDLPCGDFHWLSHIPLRIDYIGGDIVEAIIKRNSTTYGHDFRVLDITSSKLPSVDLVLTRDCFVHLSYAAIFAAVENIKASGAKYLLTTTFPGRENRDIQTGDWRPVNLQAAPFCFPNPLEVINEGCTEFGGQFTDKSLALFEVGKINRF
jgi:hypothetical protein